ncbi:MAG: asparagine synthase (glutamine-hydrolyzing) [Candidatus Wallbacteria bacterium]|nr:asparagine synthase (glutamine-hydrolyzing) [Candidatus Wallbacteria bacterium]
MCGIAGALDPRADPAAWSGRLGAMARSIAHRGPDDEGIWADPEAGVGLAHRRLAILDLSPLGHQPMVSASGRYVIVFNGEIYNFAELRRELLDAGLATAFRGQSDTEVMLAAMDGWGVERATARFAGIFAFALWDKQERVLFLARDPLGVKPLYYGVSEGVFLFGSELKALRAHPAFFPRIDRAALALYMRHMYVPAPHSIYEGISKLTPGTLARVEALAGGTFRVEPRVFWSARQAFETGMSEPLRMSPEEAVDELEEALRQAVTSQMVSDVPLGAFLSGGIDSSLVVALMQKHSSRPVRTFSIGFDEARYDESPHARRIAAHLGTEHVEQIVRPADCLELLPRLPALWDEPFADSSQLPTFLLSALTRRHVTVSLSGDGGDELFCGYQRYALAHRLWSAMRLLPAGARRGLASVAASLAGRVPAQWPLERLWPRPLVLRGPRDVLDALSGFLGCPDRQTLYRMLVSHWRQPEQLVLGAAEPRTPLDTEPFPQPARDFRESMMFWDIVTYLPDDILTKVDRASMGVGLEARVPLLDHRLVELVARIPLELKVREGEPKWVLRRVLERYVPRALFDRPKVGFGVPIDEWLRGPLRDWAESLLDEGRLAREGFLAPQLVRSTFRQHLEGRRLRHHQLWCVLMFQSWLEQTTGPGNVGPPATP